MVARTGCTFFRSHFECQRWVGTGITRDDFADGYLNRFMQNMMGAQSPLRGAALGGGLPTHMQGAVAVPSIASADSFNISNRYLCEGSGCAENRLTESLREIHSHDVDLTVAERDMRDDQMIMVESISEIQAVGADYQPSAGGLQYSGSSLGRGLKLCAQLLKAGVPLEVASMSWNIGWDTHSNQFAGGTNRFTDPSLGYHAGLAAGASDFLTFYRDMGALMEDVVVLVGSEFGRTKKQNGSNGSDHGEGGAWFAFGGPTSRRIAPDVSTLDDSVVGNNWLPTVTNYRSIIGEIMVRHMGMSENLVSAVFPGHSFTNYQLFGGTA